MDDFFLWVFVAITAALFGFVFALVPDRVVRVTGNIEKVLTVEYKQNVYKLVLLEK